MAVKDKIDEDSLIDWNVENEVQLFQAMRGHKPVGVNRYFQMACIHEKLSNSLNKEIASQVIWEKLDTMYDMAALHESEIIPFPNDEMEFSLPQTDFGSFLTEKQGSESIDTSPVSSKTSNTPKNEIKPVKSENANQEIKSKSGKESYPGKGKTSELLSATKGAKNDTPNVKNPKSESIQSSSSKSSTSKTETSTSRSSQVTKPSLKEPMSSSKNIKQESSASKNSKDNSSPRNAKVESIKKMESSTAKNHKSDSSQSKVQAKEKGSSQKGDKLETNSSSKSKDVSRSSRESSKSRNNNDSSSDDMPLSSVTKSKKPEESSLKRKRPSRHTDTKSSSPNISSKRRRN